MEGADRAVVEAPRSLRHRKKDRTRREIQAEALRLFAEKGYQSTTVEEIASAAEVAPRTFFRYFPTKEEVVFWSEYQPALADFVDARPGGEPAVEALRRGLVDGLAVFYAEDHDRLLERVTLAYRTPALHPRLRQQQAVAADRMAEILAGRLGVAPGGLEVRAFAAAMTSALWVAVDEWQAHDGVGDLGALIDRALGTVLDGSVATAELPRRARTATASRRTKRSSSRR
jgi:AcrR family transcriptional regulator